MALGSFWFFAIFYSAPPIRAKAKPFVDSFFSAGHYVATGVFGYFLLVPNENVPWLAIIAAMSWSVAMHVYSAVPDIAADSGAGLKTTATHLGFQRAIWYCMLLYTLAAILASSLIGPLILFLLVPYIALLLLSLNASAEKLLVLYSYFPYLNALVGMILTFVAFSLNGWL